MTPLKGSMNSWRDLDPQVQNHCSEGWRLESEQKLAHEQFCHFLPSACLLQHCDVRTSADHAWSSLEDSGCLYSKMNGVEGLWVMLCTRYFKVPESLAYPQTQYITWGHFCEQLFSNRENKIPIMLTFVLLNWDGVLQFYDKLKSPERREPLLLRKCLLHKTVLGIFLICDWCGRTQPTSGPAIPALVVLGSTRKWLEPVIRRKPVSSTPPWPLHHLLPPGSCPAWVAVFTAFDDELWYGTVSRVNHFLSKQLFLMTSRHGNSNSD